MISRTVIILILFACSLSTQAQTLRRVASIDLPGPKGQRFDYLTIDDEDHWLLSAHLGPGILYVIDLQTNKLVQTISGLPGVTGVEYVPGFRKAYTSDWGEEKNRHRGFALDENSETTCYRGEAQRKHLSCTISQDVHSEHPRKSCRGY